MWRHVLTILLTVTLLFGAAFLLLPRLGWQITRTQTAETPAPETPAEPSVSGTAAPEVPVVPAPPISPPVDAEPVETQPVPVQPAPAAPVPSVKIPPQATPNPTGTKLAPRPKKDPPSLPPKTTPSAPTLLKALNDTRSRANLPPVTTQPEWQTECAAHAQYLTVTDTAQHSEDPTSPHYSAQGAACAHGHYYVTMRPDATAAQAVTYWANGPFHLPQLLDPRLKTVALTARHDTGGDIRTAVVLDVKRGRSGNAKYPVKFPAPGRTVTPGLLSQYEFPDALPGCPGYAHPVGAPIALLLGGNGTASRVNLRVNGQDAPACLLTASTFNGSSESETRLGRNVLAAQGVVITLPRYPLPAGANVNVSFTTPQGKVSWAFQTK